MDCGCGRPTPPNKNFWPINNMLPLARNLVHIPIFQGTSMQHAGSSQNLSGKTIKDACLQIEQFASKNNQEQTGFKVCAAV